MLVTAAWAPPPRTRPALPALLFLLTVLTTLGAGFLLHISFVSETPEEAMALLEGVLSRPATLLQGFPYCLTLLVILLAHEMGHYLACRYYGIHATPPYTIPAPPLLPIPPPLSTLLGTSFIPFNPFGTFGAVIRIRSPFLNRRQLFDVGIAGPLAGFVFIIPALIYGLMHSRDFVFTEPIHHTLEFGEPLLFRLATAWFYTAGDGTAISLHPVGFAAWFGMLATSINLLPIGQLDGGHIVYSLFGARAHRIISACTFAGMVGISFLSWPMLGYLFFALVLLFMGFHHPPAREEVTGVGKGRVLLALLGLLVFILTFIVVPVQLVEHTARV